MYAQFFGNYLLSRGAITGEQLIQAMQKKSASRMRLGTLAMHAGYMTAHEVEQVVAMQTQQDARFGELAVREGYLTEEQVTELLKSQSPDFLQLGQTLVDEGILNNQQLQDLMLEYQSENELQENDYSYETMDSINHLVENFFANAQRPLSTHEIAFVRLLFTNLVRFIGDDFTPVTPYLCKEYPTNVCVSQQVNGQFSAKISIDMPKTTCIDFASRYVDEEFSDFNEYVQASLEDFLNLHNGLFNINMSNDFSIELTLTPPMTETAELLTFETEAYLFPIVYPFGIIHFVLEVFKSE